MYLHIYINLHRGLSKKLQDKVLSMPLVTLSWISGCLIEQETSFGVGNLYLLSLKHVGILKTHHRKNQASYPTELISIRSGAKVRKYAKIS